MTEQEKLTINEVFKLSGRDYKKFFSSKSKIYINKTHYNNILLNMNKRYVFAFRLYDKSGLVFAMRLKNKIYGYYVGLPSLPFEEYTYFHPLTLETIYDYFSRDKMSEGTILDIDDWNFLKNKILCEKIKNGDKE